MAADGPSRSLINLNQTKLLFCRRLVWELGSGSRSGAGTLSLGKRFQQLLVLGRRSRRGVADLDADDARRRMLTLVAGDV